MAQRVNQRLRKTYMSVNSLRPTNTSLTLEEIEQNLSAMSLIATE